MNTRLKTLVVAIASFCFLQGCEITPTKTAEQKSPQKIPDTQQSKSIAFGKIVTNIPLGTTTGRIHYGWACATGNVMNWRGGNINLTYTEQSEAFRKEFTSFNYRVPGDPYNLFDAPAELTADLVVSGVIEQLEINICFPFSGSPSADFGNTSLVKGASYIKIAWQVFSREENKVVSRLNAFSANLRNLIAQPEFYELASQRNSKKLNPENTKSGPRSKI